MLVDTSSSAGTQVSRLTGDNMGGWYVSYAVAGRQGTVHLTAGDAISDGLYEGQFGDLYVQLGFDEAFDHFDIVNVFADYDGDEISGSYIHGDPTAAAALPSGTAVYRGTLKSPSGRRYFDSNRGHLAYDQVWGDVTLTANFTSDALTGTIDNIRIKVHGPSRTQSRPDTRLTFSGALSESAFAARVAGTGYFSGFTGDVTGSLYGPGAEEAGGVVTAQAGPNNVFLAPFGADQAERPAPPAPDAATVNAAIAQHPDLVLDALAAAARSTPNFGSVAQSSNRNAYRGTTDRVTTTFDGAGLSVNVARPDRPDLRFGASGVAGDAARHALTTTGNTVTLARLHVLPARSSTRPSAAEYLALGTWAHLTGNPYSLRFHGVEIGTFADVSDAVPPVVTGWGGRWAYNGDATGIYAVRYGTGYEDIPRGSFEHGSFAAPVRLTATFDIGAGDTPGGAIGGCIGCGEQVALDGLFVDAETDEEKPVKVRSSNFAMWFPEVGFNEKGEFTGEWLAVQTPYFSSGGQGVYTAGLGTWGGVLFGRNNHPFTKEFPARVMGTFGAEHELPDGTRGGVLGSFLRRD